MDELRHECGIAALYHLANGQKAKVWTGDPDELTRLMPRMLLDLQNRGQLAAGMTSYKPGRERLLDTHKDVGTVAEAFSMSRPHKFASILEEYAGRAVIGHTRYATSGPTGKSYAQPFEQVRTGASGSGSPSPSTATSPISKNSKPNCSPTPTTT